MRMILGINFYFIEQGRAGKTIVLKQW